MAHAGAIWLHLGGSLAPSWGPWAPKEVPLGPFWRLSDLSWASLGCSWSRLGPIWSIEASAASDLAPSGSDLEPSEPKFSSILRSLGSIFDSSQQVLIKVCCEIMRRNLCLSTSLRPHRNHAHPTLQEIRATGAKSIDR